MHKVGVILNSYRRPHTLKEQYEAVINQTVEPYDILLWQNNPCDPSIQFDTSFMEDVKIASNNDNFGVWSRFAFALNSSSDYICMLDDDTIPAEGWFENCLDCMEEQEGLYGSNGVIFNDPNYSSYTQHGWARPNNEIEQVDIVGHSWFFPREYLGAFWREAPIPLSLVCGEDMHFSYSIQKYLGKNTYVPPHPDNNHSIWGSDKTLGYKYGVDQHAVSVNYHGTHFALSLQHYIKKGFKCLNF